jgi:hypothetical protein
MNLGDQDILVELLERVGQLEAQNDTHCLEFYKRIVKRIEDGDDLALEAKDRASRAYEASNDDDLSQRLWEDMEYFEAYLVQFEDEA